MPAVSGLFASSMWTVNRHPEQKNCVAGNPASAFSHRQLELVDGEHRRVVESDQRTAGLDEVAQLLHAIVAQAAGVALRNRAGPVAVDNLALGDVGDHDRIETLAQMAARISAL